MNGFNPEKADQVCCFLGDMMTVILAQFLRMILRGSKSNGVQGLQGNWAAVQLLIVLNSSMFQMIMSEKTGSRKFKAGDFGLNLRGELSKCQMPN